MTAITCIVILLLDWLDQLPLSAMQSQTHDCTRKLFDDERWNIHRIPSKLIKFGYNQQQFRVSLKTLLSSAACCNAFS